jgi:hypothetical protein
MCTNYLRLQVPLLLATVIDPCSLMLKNLALAVC